MNSNRSMKTVQGHNIINVKRGRTTTIMTLLLSVLTLFASLEGLLNKKIYGTVLPSNIISQEYLGIFSQDLISVFTGLTLFILSILLLKRLNLITFIVNLGLTGYIFYGYALYSIQTLYTSIYLVYIGILGLSVYTLIYGLTSFEHAEIKHVQLPKALRISTSIFLIVMVLIMTPAWIANLLPYIAKNTKPNLFGVIILDLGIVFPAFMLIAIKLIQNSPFGNIFAGIAIFKVFTICFSLVLGSFIASFYDIPADFALTVLFGAITVFSLVFCVLYLRKLKVVNKEFIKCNDNTTIRSF